MVNDAVFGSFLWRRLLFIVFLFIGFCAQAQLDYSAGVKLHGLGGVNENLPFWMQHNQRGRLYAETKFLGIVGAKMVHGWGESSLLEAGAGMFFEDAEGSVKLDELYLRYQNPWVEVVLGVRQDEVEFAGLGASNRSILRSLNTRPMPGIQLKSSGPIMVFPKAGLGFEFAIEEYFMDDEQRYVNDPRVHHKSLHLVVQPVKDFQLKAGLRHYVMWAGNSDVLGPQPSSFEDYIRVMIGWNGGAGSIEEDQQNSLGNSLGSYEVTLSTMLKEYSVSLIWNSIFEDGSGMRLGNTPDGRYGLFVQDTQKKGWIHSFMYEFYYTKHQSHTTTGIHKYDNYFNNIIYQSGWTYQGQTIGVPFFTPNASGSGIANNVFAAHHLGLGGVAFDRLPFRFLNSYRRNYGLSNMNFDFFTKDPPEQVFSSMLELSIPLNGFWLNVQMGSDFSNDAGPELGAGLGIHYRL